MCVHDRVCSFGVWQMTHGSPLCRGDFLGTWMTLGKAGTRGASPLLVVHGAGGSRHARCVWCGSQAGHSRSGVGQRCLITVVL